MIASRSDGSNSRFAISDETAGAVRVTVGTNGFMGIGEEGQELDYILKEIVMEMLTKQLLDFKMTDLLVVLGM